ncbi:MAG: hypothetical protein F6K58_14140 [Symploca sp. SIO2E9]|nr:hypothetical protein [Symploca sp. SIO2E9]
MKLYSVRILRGLEDKILAQRLLYEVYVKELGWIPPEGNPSNLKIQASPLGNIMVDDYDSVSIQFGGFCGKKLIGIHRIIPRLNGRLDVENYIELPFFLQKDCHYELNRLAIDINFRKSPIFSLIIAAEIRYLIKCKFKYVIGTAIFPEPGSLFCKVGATRINFPEFKYHLSDPKPVSLVVLFLEEKENFNRLFRVTDKLIQVGKVKQFDID